MKKTLSVAAFGAATVLAASVVPTNDAQAIPAFARQTGMACLTCHFQSFPSLNAFGRAFKQGAFVDGGGPIDAVEEEHLNIPGALNASLVVRMQYQKDGGAAYGATGNEKGTLALPTDVNLLMAGRIGEHTGAFVEFGGGAGDTGTPANNWQLMNSFDFGGVKGGVNAFQTGFGPTAGIETSNVFGQHSGLLGGKDVSVIENIINAADFGIGAGTTQGVALWAGNADFTAQLAGIAPGPQSSGGNVGTQLAYLARAFVTPQVGNWDIGVGATVISGKAHQALKIPMEATAIDAQAQGEVAGMQLGVYADYATVKGKSNVISPTLTVSNFGALGDGSKRSGFSLRANLKLAPQVLVGAGYASYSNTAGGAGDLKNRFHLAATYELYQNMELTLVYNADKTEGNGNGNSTLIDIEALM